jgi:hypothetical protein
MSCRVRILRSHQPEGGSDHRDPGELHHRVQLFLIIVCNEESVKIKGIAESFHCLAYDFSQSFFK